MKKVVYLFAAGLLVLACNPNQPGGGSEKKAVFEVSPMSSKVTAIAQALEFNVNCNKDWEAMMNLGTWAKVQVQDISSGKIVVNLKINGNEADRTDTLVVSSGTKKLKVPITQQGIESILSRTAVTLTGLEPQTIDITTSSDWTAAPLSSTSADTWLSVSPMEGAPGTTTVTVSATEDNVNVGDRNMFLKFVTDGHVVLATITHKQTDAILKDSDKFELSNGEQEFSVNLQTNVDVKTTIDCDWIEPVMTKSLNSLTETFRVSANPEQTVREGKITFQGGDCTETVSVFQAECDVLAFTNGTFEASAEGGVFSIELRTNVEYEVTWPAEDWISKADAVTSPMAIRADALWFQLTQNFRLTPREAEILVADANSALNSTIKVVQAGGNPEFLKKENFGVYSADGSPIVEYAAKKDQISVYRDGNRTAFRIINPEEETYLELSGIPAKIEVGQELNLAFKHNRDFKPAGNGNDIPLYVAKTEAGRAWLVSDEGLGFIIKM